MMSDTQTNRFTEANKAAWNASAPLHGEGADWENLLASAAEPGFSVLDDYLTGKLRELGLAGGSAVQIGCNNARELLSLASLGIRPALGLDQSGAFLELGAQLAAAAGQSPKLVEADIYALPDGLGQHELALITIGVLSWMPDLPRFFEIVAGLIAPGGCLVIYETHPFLEIFDPAGEKPFEPAISYFDRSPQEITEAITYDGQDHGDGETGYWFVHTLGAIVTACIGAGLRIELLDELPHTIREPEYDIYEGREAQIPMSLCLIARKAL